MLGKCKMTGNEKMFPCSAAGCPLFGDCLVEYEKEHKKNTAKPQTNADRIRAMSDEELAEFLCGVFDDDYGGTSGKFINGTLIEEYDEDSIADWLKQPADMRGEEDG